jgi:hypothetical protein
MLTCFGASQGRSVSRVITCTLVELHHTFACHSLPLMFIKFVIESTLARQSRLQAVQGLGALHTFLGVIVLFCHSHFHTTARLDKLGHRNIRLNSIAGPCVLQKLC